MSDAEEAADRAAKEIERLNESVVSNRLRNLDFANDMYAFLGEVAGLGDMMMVAAMNDDYNLEKATLISIGESLNKRANDPQIRFSEL